VAFIGQTKPFYNAQKPEVSPSFQMQSVLSISHAEGGFRTR